MITKLLVNTPFDIEVVFDNIRKGMFINRPSDSTDTSDYSFTNQKTEQKIYCLPGLSFRFDVDKGIDNSVALESSQQTDSGFLNFIYRVSKRNLTWDFGDGTQSQEYNPVHTYTNPGIYTITVTLYDRDGNPTRNPYTYTLEILNFCGDHVAWYTKNAALLGLDYTPASTPLRLQLRKMTSWQSPDLYSTVVMYASGSDSIPSTPDTYFNSKHAHLQQLWRFTEDVETMVPVNSVKIEETEIRVQVNDDELFVMTEDNLTGMNITIDNSINADDTTTRTIGQSGSKDVFYIDDTVKNYLSRDVDPVFLFASLSSNNMLTDIEETPVDVLPVKVTYGPGVELLLTTNGIRTFDLESVLFTDSEYCINISIVNQYGLIVKTDYPEIGIDMTGNDLLTPYHAKLQIIDSETSLPVQYTVESRKLSVETKGNGNFIITPTETASADSKIHAELLISDPPYTPMDTPVYVLTDMHHAHAHFLTPGFAGFIAAHGATFSTLSDNTMITSISSAALSIIPRDVELTHSCFALCVNPRDGFVYIGNESNDTIRQFTLLGEPLNDNQPIYILELICNSNILQNDNRFAYNDIHGNKILDELTGNREDDSPARLEQVDDQLCDRFNLNMNELNALSPSSLSCDIDGNVWTTLIDGVLTVRISFDAQTGFYVSAIAIPEEVSFQKTTSIEKLVERTDSGEYKWMPGRVVADRNNDIWVSYTNQQNIKLIKYSIQSETDQSANTVYPMQQLAEITFPPGTHLDDMIIDSSNNLWVLNSASLSERKIAPDVNSIDMIGGGVYHISNDHDPKILKYITEYQSPNPVSDEIMTEKFDKPSGMTFDLQDSLYVVTGSNSIVKINPGTYHAEFAFHAGSSWYDLSHDHQRLLERSKGHKCAIDAISCNSDNRLLVLNNIDKSLAAYICPESWDQVATYDVEGVVVDQTDFPDWMLVQGSGDWTGIRWINTYMKGVQGQRVVNSQKNIQVKTQYQDEIMKHNEDFDATQTFTEYAMQDTINTKQNLLLWFFNRVAGDGTSSGDTLGKTVYEKISNFVSNNADAEICNSRNLHSLATQVGCDLKSYEYSYPGSLKRLIDLLSIKLTKLKPSRDQTGSEFTKDGYANNFNHGRNIGSEPVDPATYIVKVGTRLVSRELYNSNYMLVEPMAIPGEKTNEHYSELHGGLIEYPLSMFNDIDLTTNKQIGLSWNWGVSIPAGENIFLYYDFYEYVPDSDYNLEAFTQLSGEIDWGNEQTTVSEEISLSDWSRDDGIVDTLISRNLRKGLGLLK